MKPFVLLGAACALVVAFGCGPMRTPLPQRFDPETQREIDDSWNRAFTPSNKLNHQDLLDVMLGTQAYQLGVDTFTLRAEKSFAGGKVVMEVRFDRAKPDDDRFDVMIYDANGKPMRTERYTRKEVEETYDELFVIPPENAFNPEPAELVAKRADQKARLERICVYFPAFKALRTEAPKPRARD